MNPYDDDEFEKAERWYEQHWLGKHSAAASKEGWDIFECSGSANGPWQVMHNDSPDDDTATVLKTDEEAWLKVRTGTGEHHSLARHFLFTYVPEHEWKYINEWYAKEYPENA